MAARIPAVLLGDAALGALMPLHLRVAPDGVIDGAGRTLVKLMAGEPLQGRSFFDVFEMHRPRGVVSTTGLSALAGTRLKLGLKARPHTGFKGEAVPLEAGQGLLFNLSFGIALAEAVALHRLTDSDFAATDLTVEMLYLIEAKSAVLDELRRLNHKLHNAKTQAEEEALTDTLTGLRNRRAMDQVMRASSRAGMPFGLVHIDLDFFKQVNDTLGHGAGDHVLVEVGRILREETRGGDIVARVGGDEFVLVLPDLTDPDMLDGIAQRILSRIEEPIAYAGHACRISASIGTTVSTDYPEPNPDRMLGDADRALYAAKRAGRGRVVRFPSDLPSETGAA